MHTPLHDNVHVIAEGKMLIYQNVPKSFTLWDLSSSSVSEFKG
jgi:hypothetical protein